MEVGALTLMVESQNLYIPVNGNYIPHHGGLCLPGRVGARDKYSINHKSFPVLRSIYCKTSHSVKDRLKAFPGMLRCSLVQLLTKTDTKILPHTHTHLNIKVFDINFNINNNINNKLAITLKLTSTLTSI